MALTRVSRGLLSTSIVDNGNATAITIDSSENVGLGMAPTTNNISKSISLVNGGSIFGYGSGTYITGNSNYNGAWNTVATGADSRILLDGNVVFSRSSSASAGSQGTVSESMRIDSAGKVAMGTSSADADASVLSIKGTDPAQIYDGQIIIHGSATSGAADTGAGIGFKGHHGTGNRNLGAIQCLKENGTSGNIDTYMRFVIRSNSGGLAEAMRIDSSGNLLVGQSAQTTPGFGNTEVGSAIKENGTAAFSRAGNSTQPTLVVNKNTNDGKIVNFQKDGTTVGSISTQGGELCLMAPSGGGIRLRSSMASVIPVNTSRANLDNTTDLGSSAARFKDFYRSGSTISTSDRNMKQDIRDLTDAERNVAVAAKGLLKAFRFIDTVEAEGDSANIHFGIIAQDLAAAFTAEGLDANDYQVYRADTFTDDDGNEQTRLGICYENLLAFIISAI